MKKAMLRTPKGTNLYDNLTDGIAETSVYSDRTVMFPDFSKAKPDDNVPPEWFYPVFDGSNGFSEYSATIMYTRQQDIFPNVGTLLMGIALIEMKHIGKLSDFIVQIGGDVSNIYSTKEVELGNTEKEAIDIAVESEKKTIDFYDTLLEKLSRVDSVTAEIATQLINKLKADEEVHLAALTARQATY